MIAITGATGPLGRLVIEHLLNHLPAAQLVELVRNPAKAAGFAERGVTVRAADYGDAASRRPARAGADKLLLISSSAIGQRAAQHTLRQSARSHLSRHSPQGRSARRSCGRARQLGRRRVERRLV